MDAILPPQQEAGYEQYPEELRGEHAGSSRHSSFKN